VSDVISPLSDGTGLLHAVISVEKRISFTFLSCRKLLPDPRFHRAYLQDAWDELEAAIPVT